MDKIEIQITTGDESDSMCLAVEKQNNINTIILHAEKSAPY
jgi:hypothetical protein